MVSAVSQPLNYLSSKVCDVWESLRDLVMRIVRYVDELFRSFFYGPRLNVGPMLPPPDYLRIPSRLAEGEGGAITVPQRKEAASAPQSAGPSPSYRPRARSADLGQRDPLGKPLPTFELAPDSPQNPGDEEESRSGSSSPSLSASSGGAEAAPGLPVINDSPRDGNADRAWRGEGRERVRAKVCLVDDRFSKSQDQLKEMIARFCAVAALDLCYSGKLTPETLKDALKYRLTNPRVSVKNWKHAIVNRASPSDDARTTQKATELFYNCLSQYFQQLINEAKGQNQYAAALCARGNAKKKEFFAVLAKDNYLSLFELQIRHGKKSSVDRPEPVVQSHYFAADAAEAVEEADSPTNQDVFILTALKVVDSQKEKAANFAARWIIEERFPLHVTTLRQFTEEFLEMAKIEYSMSQSSMQLGSFVQVDS